LRHAPILEAPHSIWEAFAARFPYQETDDQLTAIADVVADLEKGSPMDRLIVGDVGFGKTEVAMRAAFRRGDVGMQVAVICPTTLLARQHYRSFAERFRGFPVIPSALVALRFGEGGQCHPGGMADGSVDIVVGTHALLAKGSASRSWAFWSSTRNSISACPQGTAEGDAVRGACADPDRHAHPAHAATVADRGARPVDHRTPPVDRLAIRTYVSEFDTVTIREALLRERFRGGQSFYVVPRIADLPEIEDFLKTHVPEVSYVIAHGQLAAGDLDDRMNQFYDGKYDVLWPPAS
jgi:transcription-repair coupling factor (superfamily II helicase)